MTGMVPPPQQVSPAPLATPPEDPHARTRVMGRRVVATLIDAVAWGAIAGVIFFSLAEKTSTTAVSLSGFYARVGTGDTAYVVTGDRATVYYLLTLVLGVGYWLVPTALTGMTLGKLVTGIHVIGPDDQRPGFGRALVRQLFWIVDDFPYFIPALTGFIVALATPSRTRVGDIVAKTLVVRRTSA